MKKKFKIFYTTCENKIDAKKIARSLLSNKKAKCINIFKNVESFYIDNDSIVFSEEIIMIIKTHNSKKKIESALENIHPYETPIILELKANQPNKKYLDWFLKNSE